MFKDKPVADMSSKERDKLNHKVRDRLEDALLMMSYRLHDGREAIQTAENIFSSYDDKNRAFHTPQHILQILPPELQEKIKKSSDRGILNGVESKELIFAAYHDVVYHVDSNISEFSVKSIATLCRNAGQIIEDNKTLFSNIKDKITIGNERDKHALQTIFGLDDDSKVTFRGPPLNEFLSACQFVRDARILGFDNETILEGIIRIQMTVPFQQDHAVDLYNNSMQVARDFLPEREGRGGLVFDMVNRAVDMSNRDIGNLVSPKAWKMLEGDCLMFKENGGDLTNPELLKGMYEDASFLDFLTFANSQNRLAQPRLPISEGRELSIVPDIENPEYIRLKNNAASNIEVIRLANKVMVCVLTDEQERIAGFLNDARPDCRNKLLQSLREYPEPPEYINMALQAVGAHLMPEAVVSTYQQKPAYLSDILNSGPGAGIGLGALSKL